MRALLQRVSEARVEVAGEVVGEVGNGLLVLLAVAPADDAATARRLAEKVRRLRIFEDGAGRMNVDLDGVGGDCLVISQFTLYADARSGNRPGFTRAAPPEQANDVYEAFVAALREAGVRTATGRFGTTMQVSLVNRGPVTIWLDSDELF